MRSFAFSRLLFAKNCGKGSKDFGTTKVSLECLDLLNGSSHVLVVVLYAALFKHELVRRAVAADIELASVWQTLDEENECQSCKFDPTMHGVASINQKDILFPALLLVFHFLI